MNVTKLSSIKYHLDYPCMSLIESKTLIFPLALKNLVIARKHQYYISVNFI